MNLNNFNQPLPSGFYVWMDNDGDWWLAPPEYVTIFSEPGESALLGACVDAEQAVSDARAYLEGVA